MTFQSHDNNYICDVGHFVLPSSSRTVLGQPHKDTQALDSGCSRRARIEQHEGMKTSGKQPIGTWETNQLGGASSHRLDA